MKTVIVHVNQHVIKHNTKHGKTLPTLTIKHPDKGTLYAREVHGNGASVVDSNAPGRKPLHCGARVWVEYEINGFTIIGETMTFTEIQEEMRT
jgi:hypothetical protein